MKYLVICVISAFMAITLSHESRGAILTAPFYFYYNTGAFLSVKVNLKNMPKDVDFRIHTWCSSIFSHGIRKGSDFFSIESNLWCPETKVFIELLSRERSSYHMKITILEGKIEDQSDGKIADQRFDYNDVCLYNVEPCIIELDLDRTNPDVNTAQSTRNVIPNTRATETGKHPTYLSYSESELKFKTSTNSGNNVKSPPQHGNSAKTTPHYEIKPINTPHYGYKSTTTPHFGSNVATAPKHGNIATTTPHYGNKSITAPHSGNNVITSPKHGNIATTTPHYGNKPITTPHHGKKPTTTPHSGSNVATAPKHGNIVTTSPKHGNIATTTPQHENKSITAPHSGNKVTTTPHSGNIVTTSPKHGNIATTTPQHEKSVTTSPDYGDNVKTKKLYENNGRTSEQTINDTNGTGELGFSQTYIYVIVSVIGLCVVLFVTCILCTKKYCHRKKQQPVKTLELDTYVTANDVVYADLGLAQRSTLPPRRDEESPYAQIIGVMRPGAKEK